MEEGRNSSTCKKDKSAKKNAKQTIQDESSTVVL